MRVGRRGRGRVVALVALFVAAATLVALAALSRGGGPRRLVRLDGAGRRVSVVLDHGRLYVVDFRFSVDAPPQASGWLVEWGTSHYPAYARRYAIFDRVSQSDAFMGVSKREEVYGVRLVPLAVVATGAAVAAAVIFARGGRGVIARSREWVDDRWLRLLGASPGEQPAQRGFPVDVGPKAKNGKAKNGDATD